jgi:cytochrome P450
LLTRSNLGITSTFLLYQISRHPDIQEALHQELLSVQAPFFLPDSPAEFRSAAIPAPDVLEQLPLLNGIIRESLRLRNNQPNMDPRATPAGTYSTVGPVKNLPPGIRVGYFAWLLHRRDDLYPDALQWNPWRWFDESEKNGMSKQGFFAFGRGPRGCVGQHVAVECEYLNG